MTAAALLLLAGVFAQNLPDVRPVVSHPEIVVRDVAPEDVAEGCAAATDNRTLLRFQLTTFNDGLVDLVLGDPQCPDCDDNPGAQCDNPFFQCSPAHGHAHFGDFFEARLEDGDSNLIATGSKQGFCLLDSSSCQNGKYTCANQGLTAGCFDVYSRFLPCQYVDLTDVEVIPGETYTLTVELDPTDFIEEADETNNVMSIPIEMTCDLLFEGARCTDGDACTIGDRCGGGSCEGAVRTLEKGRLKLRFDGDGDGFSLKGKLPADGLGRFPDDDDFAVALEDGAGAQLYAASIAADAFSVKGSTGSRMVYEADADTFDGGVERIKVRLRGGQSRARIRVQASGLDLDAASALDTVDVAVTFEQDALEPGCSNRAALACDGSERRRRCE